MKIIRKIWIGLLDLIFPRSCIGCKKEGVWLCSQCVSALNVRVEYFPNGSKYLDHLIVSAERHDILSESIRKFKYAFYRELSETLGGLMVQSIKQTLKNTERYVVIAVPLHRSRQNWRGFNQAQSLAKVVSTELQLPLLDDLLIRKKNTLPRTHLSRAERLSSLDDAFEVNTKINIPEQVLLIDDIHTTGATLEECAKTLKQAGVKKVIGVVLSHGT